MQDKKGDADKMEEREALIDGDGEGINSLYVQNEGGRASCQMTMRHLSSCGRVSL